MNTRNTEKASMLQLKRELDLAQKQAEGERLRRVSSGSPRDAAGGQDLEARKDKDESWFLDWKEPEIR
jgi:hypothetical protein